MPVACNARSLGMLIVALLCCAGAMPLEPLRVDGDRIVDTAGRSVLLHGMNCGEKSSQRRHESWHGPEDFHNMRRWGMNCLRLLVHWSAVEPEPGAYDEDYLQRLDRRIQWAHDAGLYVILDMHQDLYSEAIPGGNGAPAWAVITDARPDYRYGGIWSAAYTTSPMLHAAFDNFWKNTPGPDGVGIQDRYAMAWAYLARRYAGESAVIGFDLMNEPFPGSRIRDAVWNLWRALPDILRGVDAAAGDVVYSDAPLPGRVMAALDRYDNYRHFVAAFESTQRRFEQGPLAAMYRRVAGAIRAVGSTQIIFLESGPFSNFGAPSFIEPLTDAQGERDPQQAYIPHGYDIVVDTPYACRPHPERVVHIFDNLAKTGRRLAMPMIVGEWGALYGSPGSLPAARMYVAALETHLAGDTYWDYHRDIENAACFEALRRPYPERVAGRLLEYRYDFDAGAFTCAWEEDAAIAAPTRIYVHEGCFSDAHTVSLEPAGAGFTYEPVEAGLSAGHLLIPPTGAGGPRRLSIAPRPPTVPIP